MLARSDPISTLAEVSLVVPSFTNSRTGIIKRIVELYGARPLYYPCFVCSRMLFQVDSEGWNVDTSPRWEAVPELARKGYILGSCSSRQASFGVHQVWTGLQFHY